MVHRTNEVKLIVSNEHRFVFIHIPKCAGSAVKARIGVYDETDGYFTERVEEHACLGKLDYGHLPLAVLAEHFPEQMRAVRDYWSFAIVRDPQDRFLSGISQRLKMYRGTYLHASNDRRILEEIDSVTSSLLNCEKFLPPDLIHFQPQSDFVFLDGEQVVDVIYPAKSMDRVFADLALRIGIEGFREPDPNDTYADNRSFVFRSELQRGIVETARPLARIALAQLPESVKRQMRSRLYVAPNERFARLAIRADLGAFIDEYYSADLRLVEQVLESPLS